MRTIPLDAKNANPVFFRGRGGLDLPIIPKEFDMFWSNLKCLASLRRQFFPKEDYHMILFEPSKVAELRKLL